MLRHGVSPCSNSNFAVEFMEETDDFWFGVASKENKIRTCLKNNPDVIYEQNTDVWHKDTHKSEYPDYWLRLRLFNNHIVIQDYSGIKIYNSKLDVIFSIDVPITEHSESVLGCEIIGSKIIVWDPTKHNFCSLMEEHNDNCEKQIHEIKEQIFTVNSKKKGKKLVFDATKHIEFVCEYTKISPCIDKFVFTEYDLPDVLR